MIDTLWTQPPEKKTPFDLLELRAQLLKEHRGELPDACRLPDGYRLIVSSTKTVCECCGTPLRVQHAVSRRPVSLLLGRPELRHRIRQCPACNTRYECEKLHELIAPHGNWGYDVIAQVGLERYAQHRQDAEIVAHIAQDHCLDVPQGSIHSLAGRFLDSFMSVHEAHVEDLRRQLTDSGGYVLHLDGTCEAGTKVLFAAVDGITGTVLWASEMHSENERSIKSAVDACVEKFGLPLAVLSDLSPNIARAVAHLPPSVKRLLCHYHFLDAVGRKLIQSHHTEFIKRLNAVRFRRQFHSLRSDLVQCTTRRSSRKDHRVVELFDDPDGLALDDPVMARRSLAYVSLCWLADCSNDLNGESFPFDLPVLALYRRAVKLRRWFRNELDCKALQTTERTTLQTIAEKLDCVLSDPELTEAAARLEKAVQSFTAVRDALRFRDDDSSPVSRTQSMPQTCRQAAEIPGRLRRLRRKLLKCAETGNDPDRSADAGIVLRYLDKYEDRLHGHLVKGTADADPILVDRTNAVVEQLFGKLKRKWRRRAATGKLNRRLEAARPEELLLENLNSQSYLNLCYEGSADNLARTFSEHENRAAEIRARRAVTPNTRIMNVPKKLLRQPGFFDAMDKAANALAAATR